MRILFFSHYFPPEVNAPANRTFEHCREWVRLGHEVHVVTCVPSHPKGEPFPGYRRTWYQREVVEGVHVHRVWTYLAANKGKVRRAANYLSYVPMSVVRSMRLGSFDVVVATSPQFFCAAAGWLYAGLKGTPWIFELRDLWPDSIAAVGAIRKGFLLKLLERFELHLYRSASGVACVTRSFIENLGARGIAEEKCFFVPNGVEANTWVGGDGGRIRLRHGISKAETVAAYIGTIGMAHGVGTILEAASILAQEHNPIQFLVVGDGAELEAMRARVLKEGLPNVIFTGLVPHAEVRDYMAATDIALVILRDTPLFRTVLPSKMFEAMGAGKPVVLGVEGEARDVLNLSGGGTAVTPENARALAAALRDLAGDSDKRKRLGESGRLFVEREFSRPVWARRYVDWMEGKVLPPIAHA
jgi:glycosyltransferase involved in cell wall biosynthesis